MTTALVEGLNLGLDLGQGNLESGATVRIRRALTENIFALQMQLLALTSEMRFVHLLFLQIFRTAGKRRRLRASCHLFLHEFALPTSSHA